MVLASAPPAWSPPFPGGGGGCGGGGGGGGLGDGGGGCGCGGPLPAAVVAASVVAAAVPVKFARSSPVAPAKSPFVEVSRSSPVDLAISSPVTVVRSSKSTPLVAGRALVSLAALLPQSQQRRDFPGARPCAADLCTDGLRQAILVEFQGKELSNSSVVALRHSLEDRLGVGRDGL